jgi:hypothetical protein
METQFKIRSTKTPVVPLLTYQEGKLKGVVFDTPDGLSVTPEFFVWVIDNMYDLESGMAKMRDKGYDIEEITVEVKAPTFDEFWDAYNHKSMSGKKIAREKWEKLSASQKIKAMKFIGAYDAELRANSGVAKMYAKTYLHKQVWQV